jgi:hypothetical protein
VIFHHRHHPKAQQPRLVKTLGSPHPRLVHQHEHGLHLVKYYIFTYRYDMITSNITFSRLCIIKTGTTYA